MINATGVVLKDRDPFPALNTHDIFICIQLINSAELIS